MELVTAFCPFTTTSSGETAVQTVDETRFVVDCRVKPVAFVGQSKMTLAPAGVMVSCGGREGNAILNTVPQPELPPALAVPYRTLSERIKPAYGKLPSLFLARESIVENACKTVKPVP